MLYVLTLLLLFSLPAAVVAKEIELGSYEAPMRFAWANTGGNCNGCVWISAIGVITTDTPDEFDKFLGNANGGPVRVFLHSPGGNLVAGLQLGQRFRKAALWTRVGETKTEILNDGTSDGHALQTVVAGSCASACAYAFLGGTSRQLRDEYHPDANGSLLLHQFSFSPEQAIAAASARHSLSDAQYMAGSLLLYITSMGVDARILSMASLTPADEVLRVSEGDLRRFSVLTDQTADTTHWELRPVANGIVAERLENDPSTPYMGVLIYCHQNGAAFVHFRASTEEIDKEQVDGYEVALDAIRISKSELYVQHNAGVSDILIPIRKVVVNPGQTLELSISLPHYVYSGIPISTSITLDEIGSESINLALRNCVQIS